MNTLKYEEAYLRGYETFEDVVSRLPHFLEEVYNEHWLHSAPGYQTPADLRTIVIIGWLNRSRWLSELSGSLLKTGSSRS